MATSTLITTRASYRTKGSEFTALYFWGYLAGDRWCRDVRKMAIGRAIGNCHSKIVLHIPLQSGKAIAL
jgi:hypothetical protein